MATPTARDARSGAWPWHPRCARMAAHGGRHGTPEENQRNGKAEEVLAASQHTAGEGLNENDGSGGDHDSAVEESGEAEGDSGGEETPVEEESESEYGERPGDLIRLEVGRDEVELSEAGVVGSGDGDPEDERQPDDFGMLAEFFRKEQESEGDGQHGGELSDVSCQDEGADFLKEHEKIAEGDVVMGGLPGEPVAGNEVGVCEAESVEEVLVLICVEEVKAFG